MSWETVLSIITGVRTWLSFVFRRQVAISEPAPDFCADSTEGRVSLSNLYTRGPVVLAFYYADFTPG